MGFPLPSSSLSSAWHKSVLCNCVIVSINSIYRLYDNVCGGWLYWRWSCSPQWASWCRSLYFPGGGGNSGEKQWKHLKWTCWASRHTAGDPGCPVCCSECGSEPLSQNTSWWLEWVLLVWNHSFPVCVPPLCGVAGGLKAGVKGIEVIWQAVCGADGGPVVCDMLQAFSHPAAVSSGMEAVQVLSVLPDGFFRSILRSFVLKSGDVWQLFFFFFLFSFLFMSTGLITAVSLFSYLVSPAWQSFNLFTKLKHYYV